MVSKDKSSLCSHPSVPIHLPMARTLCSRAVLSEETEGHHSSSDSHPPIREASLSPPPMGHLCTAAIPTVGQDRAPESRDLEPPDDGSSHKMCCSLVTFTPARLLRAVALGAETCRGGNRTPLLGSLQDPCRTASASASTFGPALSLGNVRDGPTPHLVLCSCDTLSTAVST